PFTGIISGEVGIIDETPVTVSIRDKSGNISSATFNITVSTWEELRINEGGKSMVIGNEQWIADDYYSGGRSSTRSGSISLPEDLLNHEPLFKTERNSGGTNNFSYQIPVLENGYFTVAVYFRTSPYPLDQNPVNPRS